MKSLKELRMQYPNDMPHITIYKRPVDMPEHYVARVSLVSPGKIKPTKVYLKRDNLKDLQDDIGKLGMYWLMSYPEDEPHILGVWI